MLRKNSILVVGAFLFTVFGSAVLVYSLDNQATGVQTRDMTRLPFTASERPKDALAVSTIQPENQPPDNWTLMATDPDEGWTSDLKAVYAQAYSGIMYFKVECYRNWADEVDADFYIWLDTDQNPSTGCPGGSPGATGAEYVIGVGYFGTQSLLEWVSGGWGNSRPFAYLDLPTPGNTFVVGVYLSDLGSPRVFDGVVYLNFVDNDWMPNSGHFTFDSCLCGDVNGDGIVNLGDVVYMISYLYRGGPPPNCQ
jgi:hypothetical protein